MRPSIILLLGVFVLAGCDSILGISDHDLAREGGTSLDGGGGGSEGGPTREGGAGSEGGVTTGCAPCVLGSAKVGSCCVN
jgi:hypothetical protein